MRLIVVLLLVSLSTAAAQTSRTEWQIPSVIALDAGSLPDAFTGRCGRDLAGGPGWGAYVALAARRSSFGLQADTRAVNSPKGDCAVDPQVVQLGPNLYEMRSGWSFAEDIPRVPLFVSTLRATLEFGPSVLRTSAKAGGGVVWGKRETPVAAASLSTRLGRGPLAFYLEFEAMQGWVNAARLVDRYRFDSTGYVSLGLRTESTRFKPRWFTLRAGMALGRSRKAR